MKFQDITNDTEKTYTLKKNEKCVFFMFNRSGDIVFKLTETGAEAHIFSFDVLTDAHQETLRLTQKHSATRTTSSALIKSALFDAGEFTYDGLIHIGKRAAQTNASQESRSLLFSPLVQIHVKPTLEILASDVKCRHAATTSPLKEESLFFAESRGLSKAQATRLLVHGFFNEALQQMQALGIDITEIEKRVTDLVNGNTISKLK